MKNVILFGAGDGGKLVSEMLKSEKEVEIIGFLDDCEKIQGKTVNGFKVLGTSDDIKKSDADSFVICVGTNMKARKTLFDKAMKAGLKPLNVIHETAIIDKTSKLGNGNIILAGVVINPSSKIGDNCFIFTGSTIDHDNSIGNNVYISPGVHLAGHVIVKDNTFLGIGANVIENITIGKNTVVGAGAAVLKDVPNNVVVAGVPAKFLKKNE